MQERKPRRRYAAFRGLSTTIAEATSHLIRCPTPLCPRVLPSLPLDYFEASERIELLMKIYSAHAKHRLSDPSEIRALDFIHEIRRSAICTVSETIRIDRQIFGVCSNDVPSIPGSKIPSAGLGTPEYDQCRSLHARGVTPMMRRKRRLKVERSPKPASKATSVIGSALCLSRAAACRRRWPRTS